MENEEKPWEPRREAPLERPNDTIERAVRDRLPPPDQPIKGYRVIRRLPTRDIQERDYE